MPAGVVLGHASGNLKRIRCTTLSCKLQNRIPRLGDDGPERQRHGRSCSNTHIAAQRKDRIKHGTHRPAQRLAGLERNASPEGAITTDEVGTIGFPLQCADAVVLLHCQQMGCPAWRLVRGTQTTHGQQALRIRIEGGVHEQFRKRGMRGIARRAGKHEFRI